MGCIQSTCRSTSAAPSAASFAPYRTHFLTGNSLNSVAVPSANLTLLFSSLTQPGFYPDSSPSRQNQDSILISTNLLPDRHLFAVFDGHGHYGAACSAFAAENLSFLLQSDPQTLTLNPSQSFSYAFQTLNSLLRASPIDDSMSGTTAIATLVLNNSLVVANVGDSRAVAGVWNSNQNRILAVDLSCDQTPFRRDEYERVVNCGARVLSVDQVEGVKDPEVQSWREGEDGDPPRLWVKDGLYPGTAFTRSVGDAAAEEIGVVAEPELRVVGITEEMRFFVVASDGVFEFLSSQAVVDIVARFKDPRNACAEIVAESYKKWLEHESRTDDITIIIVHIKDMRNPDSVATDEAKQVISIVVSDKTHIERESLACVAPSMDRNLPVEMGELNLLGSLLIACALQTLFSGSPLSSYLPFLLHVIPRPS